MTGIDWPTLFEDLGDELVSQDPLHVQRILTEKGRGHIVLAGAPNRTEADGRDVAFCDLGPVLDLWSSQGCTIDPPRARELADALRWWADLADDRLKR